MQSVKEQSLLQKEKEINKLETGNAYINDVLVNIGNPYLPFGGVKKSGFSRYHGPEGLYMFSNTKSVMVSKSRRIKEIYWFPYSNKTSITMKKLIRILYGNSNLFNKIKILINR
jgi:hypothetical protein